ncbi:MAG: hypothetical protein JSW65_05720 [Candidatus Bipolaricaulota bacterium]|nr:MAG: hypothetical protein JSW65_05720 [Candidatus Bipolaricaulota bacterium]
MGRTKTAHGGDPLERFALDGGESELTSETVWPALERAGFSQSAAVRERVSELVEEGRGLLEPRALGHVLAAEALSEEEREMLPAPVREAEYLCFCVATAGRAIDRRSKALCDEGELIDSMILDAVAMTALSAIGDRLARGIFDWASSRGLSASRAFSPGAGASGWPLEMQRFLFAHLPDRPLGVELTPHCLMRPSKSVSFVIGIGGRITQAKHPFSCEGCPRVECAYRHIPDQEMVRSAGGEGSG